MPILTATVESGHVTFEALYEQYHALVFKRAYYSLRHREDAEDVTQEVFFKASRAYSRLTHYDNLSAWLWQITTNAIRDFLRSPAKREPEHHALEEAFYLPDEQNDDPYLCCDREDLGERVESAWLTMPPQHKHVLTLLTKGRKPGEITALLRYASDRETYLAIKNARDAFKRRYRQEQEVA